MHAGLSLCLSHVPHCWKSYVAAQMMLTMIRRDGFFYHTNNGFFFMLTTFYIFEKHENAFKETLNLRRCDMVT